MIDQSYLIITSLCAIFFYIYLVFTILFLLLDNRESSTTFAWLFVLVIFPVGGLIIYFLVGRNWRRFTKKRELMEQFLEKRLVTILHSTIAKQEQRTKDLQVSKDGNFKKKILHLLFKNSHSLLTTNNALRIYQQGEEKFKDLIVDLKNAKKFIHLEYYIWRSDKLGQQIKEILFEKVKEGVEVRILYDAIGCLFLSRKYTRELRKNGIKIYPYFNFLSPMSFHTLNYRNHRKIAVIDGYIGYTGGMNVGQEYIDGGKSFPSWLDAHLRVEGEAVHILQSVFLTSWYNTLNEDLFKEKYYPKQPILEKTLPIQITTSGPDSRWESIKQLYFTLITSAEEKVYIQTPYFIPDSSVYTALKTAALSGVDVRVMLTGLPDKKLPFWSAYTYFENLLKAGVRIYHYKKGFMHGKTLNIDSTICSIGTANMDIRSFKLNYEINTLIYDRKVTKDLENRFIKDLKDCHEITINSYNKLNQIAKIRNSAARLLAPLL